MHGSHSAWKFGNLGNLFLSWNVLDIGYQTMEVYVSVSTTPPVNKVVQLHPMNDVVNCPAMWKQCCYSIVQPSILLQLVITRLSNNDNNNEQACSINIAFPCPWLHQCWTTVVVSTSIAESTSLFVQPHNSFNNIVRSTTLFVQQSLFVQQHCSFNNIVRLTTLFVQQHCLFNKIVRSASLFVQQHFSAMITVLYQPLSKQ